MWVSRAPHHTRHCAENMIVPTLLVPDLSQRMFYFSKLYFLLQKGITSRCGVCLACELSRNYSPFFFLIYLNKCSIVPVMTSFFMH